ncbi:MAG TPA: hypothetical protein VIN10_09255 [Bacteroidales bacterium]
MDTKMGKNNFFKLLFQNKSNLPSKAVSAVFAKTFPKAKNVEWFKKNGNFETVFYEEEIEKIAEFDGDGNMLIVKTNLNPALFVGKLREIAEKYGEIMNIIKIEKEGAFQYEMIVRDTELIRYLLILDGDGNEMKFEKL